MTSLALGERPVFIGSYPVVGERRFLPVSQRELDRAAAFLETILAPFRFSHRWQVLTVATPDEAAQFTPFETAAGNLGYILMSADHSPYEGHRLESILRRFPVAAIMGLSGAILESALAMGHQASALLAGRVVWARPCAYDQVAATPSARPLRWFELGPTIALECKAAAGAHIDDQEWAVDLDGDGQVLVSSRLPRLEEVKGLPTGVFGRIERGPCTCGLYHSRILAERFA